MVKLEHLINSYAFNENYAEEYEDKANYTASKLTEIYQNKRSTINDLLDDLNWLSIKNKTKQLFSGTFALAGGLSAMGASIGFMSSDYHTFLNNFIGLEFGIMAGGLGLGGFVYTAKEGRIYSTLLRKITNIKNGFKQEHKNPWPITLASGKWYSKFRIDRNYKLAKEIGDEIADVEDANKIIKQLSSTVYSAEKNYRNYMLMYLPLIGLIPLTFIGLGSSRLIFPALALIGYSTFASVISMGNTYFSTEGMRRIKDSVSELALQRHKKHTAEAPTIVVPIEPE